MKSLHSIYRKMHRKKIPLADVFDARALRVIVDDEHGTRMQEAPALWLPNRAHLSSKRGCHHHLLWQRAVPRRSRVHLQLHACPMVAAPRTVMDCHVPS